ncbi:class II fructose-bisphosphatase [Pseudenhygromyxa sp. WMMC2535]|nr:class II fructose-bisphosphatase [Pseudenhygromyxa sp. WMMC2535]NVB40572.1 class II fructose-bisphosphatase [Pseudenhygromyxa sp. WMMC2535]
MDRKLLLEYVRVTEAAAIACSRLIGSGRKEDADSLAVEAMRRAFDKVPARGTVVIGEGERDEAPMLYIGEKVGPKDPNLPEVDIAVDPLEGTNLCAHGKPGALAVMAIAHRGRLLNAPDTYMEKIAAGPEGVGVVSLEKSPAQNVRDLAEAKNKQPDEMVVVVLERPRHDQLVNDLRAAGASVRLISDGDVNPSVATGLPESGIDMFIGKGGAPEGVLAAAALRCLGGVFEGRLAFRNELERTRAIAMGMQEPDRLLRHEDLVRGNCFFVASGVTDGPMLPGIHRRGKWTVVSSLALRSDTGTIRRFETATMLEHLPVHD